ncbi:hypothetical protein HARCEL1_01625 [Halococcoides cellulosivorans]|uniref:Uncharacterized protein n=2 Tax=Halococcoides cellulosivorans TaxID=1679096 RepID=A0A2R4X463_9EURY|nr:hypothetical protein HARCEL1_01625 [Halococcoides cellulosivorans]
MNQYYPNARVFISDDGTIAMDYPTDAESVNALQTELNGIAAEYAAVVEESDEQPVTLTVVTAEVQAIVPESSLRAYLDGSIDEEAYLETIEVMDIDRPTDE